MTTDHYKDQIRVMVKIREKVMMRVRVMIMKRIKTSDEYQDQGQKWDQEQD